MTHGAVSAEERKAATNVVVFQWPCGILPTSRSPRGARPRRRAMFVEVPVSSMKTRWSGSSLSWSSADAIRATATSGRSYSPRARFFEADAVAVEEPPNRPEPRLRRRIEQVAWISSSVRWFVARIQETSLMLLQRRAASGPRWISLPSSRSPVSAPPSGSSLNPDYKLFAARLRSPATSTTWITRP